MTNTAQKTSKFITPAELAELLEVSPSTISRWVHDGDIPSTKIGRKIVRIIRKDVELLLERVATS